MTGRVDEYGRALLPVSLRHPSTGNEITFEAWVDTGFNGDVILPRGQISALGLPVAFGGKAVLADGSEVDLQTYSGQVNWLGGQRTVEVIANDGQVPLLGVGLLIGLELRVDYRRGTVSLS